jgi:diguanylate cyclase (GGDEF)-like protein/PAS domain S-box-containing protein
LAARRGRLLSYRAWWRLSLLELAVLALRVGAQFTGASHRVSVLVVIANVALFVPVLYGARRLGLRGSLAAVLGEVVVLVPVETLHPGHSWQVWGGGGAIALVILVGVVAGLRQERENRHRVALAAVEAARFVGEFEGQPLSWRGLFEALSFGVALLDDDGVIRFVNEPLLVAAARARREVVGRSLLSLVQDVEVAYGAGIVEGVINRDDDVVPVDVEFAPLRVGEHAWTIAIVHDARGRLAAERAQREAEMHALDAEAEADLERVRGERRFRLAFEHNTSGMAITDGEGMLLDVNRTYCEMLGVDASELVGHHVNEMTHPEDRGLTTEMIRDMARGDRRTARYVKRYVHRDGHVIYGELSVGVVCHDSGEVEGIVASVKDITDERALVAQLSHQALHDPLTGLANRALFQDRLERAIEARTRTGAANALFLIDLDDFKGVNDSLGHHVGDELLIEISHRLEAVTRASDTLCRFGGDEFLYLAEGLTGGVDEVAQRLLSVFDEPFLAATITLEQRASLGVVVDEGDALDANDLMRDVDTAMYEAKRRGQHEYVIFTAAMKDQVSERYQLQRDLRRALALNEISMVYQPLVNLITDEVVGFEALMRWQHPEFGSVSPGVFIALAEQSDLIIELGEYALQRACAAAASWPANSRGRFPHVSVNLSTRQFHDPHLAETIERALITSALSSKRLVLEITESATLTDVAGATSLVEDLDRLGVAIALDDFGTGYSSLSYLAHLKPVIIKIDRSFVEPIRTPLDTSPLLESIVLFGHQLELSMVAEGIETQGQLEYLRHVGCDYGQGYLFSEPLHEEAVAELLRAEVTANLV